MSVVLNWICLLFALLAYDEISGRVHYKTESLRKAGRNFRIIKELHNRRRRRSAATKVNKRSNLDGGGGGGGGITKGRARADRCGLGSKSTFDQQVCGKQTRTRMQNGGNCRESLCARTNKSTCG